MQAAEIRAMHCNDLDLDLPASRSEHAIMRSAKLCEQLTDSNLSHPAVQNPHSTAQLCWLCRELGRAQALKHGLGERCDRVRVDCGARAGQAMPPNVSIQITELANAEAAVAHTSARSMIGHGMRQRCGSMN